MTTIFTGAKEMVELAKKHFKMSDEEIMTNVYGDQQRNAIAFGIAEQTTFNRSKIVELLNMKNGANASQRIKRFRMLPTQD